MDKKYAVITIDVINSKQSSKDINNYLQDKNIIVNEKEILNIFLQTQAQESSLMLFKESLSITKVCASRGDEIQVVCSNLVDIPQVIRKLRYYFRPLKLRVGVGIGAISTEILDNSWDMNGEAFYKAREALDIVKVKERLRNTYILSHKEELNFILNSMYMLMDSIVSEWSISKWESVHAYDRFNNYEKAGEYLNKTRQAVSNNCKSAHFEKIKKCEEDIEKLINDYLIKE